VGNNLGSRLNNATRIAGNAKVHIKEGKYYANDAIVVYGTADFTITPDHGKSVTIEVSSHGAYLRNGNITINGGSINGSGAEGVLSVGAGYTEINGGNVRCGTHGMNLSNGSRPTMTGGSVSGDHGGSVLASSISQANISGGTIKGGDQPMGVKDPRVGNLVPNMSVFIWDINEKPCFMTMGLHMIRVYTY